MGFGTIIASGEGNKLMREDLLNCITEVRVEQYLDKITRFAIRFEEDISVGEPRIMKADELRCEQMITIAVKVKNTIKYLVRGPITDIKCSVQLGGPGSWYEIHGQDRRIELDRECVPHVHTGLASKAAQEILDNTFDKTDVEATKIMYGGKMVQGRPTLPTLNRRCTHDAFIRKIARDCNLHYWIEYGCRENGQALEVKEKANLKSSPPRPKDGLGKSVSVDQIKLVPTVTVILRVNVDKERCQNVTGFDLQMNAEQPNRFRHQVINDRDATIDVVQTQDPQQTIIKGGRRLTDDCRIPRDVCITTAGNPDELQCKAESALTAAGWLLDATAHTTTHMLGEVLLPHDVIEVEGLGKKHSGPYQVKAVTHVINAADQFMDVQLRRNAVGEN